MLTNFFPYVHALVEYLQLRPLTKHRINASKICRSRSVVIEIGYRESKYCDCNLLLKFQLLFQNPAVFLITLNYLCG